MRFSLCRIGVTALSLVVSFVGLADAVAASDRSEVDARVKKVHRIVVDCDEESGSDCEREIHIETSGDDTHVMKLGDHEMVWVAGGGHGSHYGFGTHFADKGGFLGVQLTELTPELREHFGVASEAGVMVAKVMDDTAAFRAGLAAGDIITRIDGESVDSTGTLTRAIRSRQEGEMVNLEIWRDGSPEIVSATLDKSSHGMHPGRHILIDCADDEEDCDAHLLGSAPDAMDIDCPEGEECEVRVACDDGDCECTVNGEIVACEELHSRHGRND